MKKQKIVHLLDKHPSTALCGAKNVREEAIVKTPVCPKCFELFLTMLDRRAVEWRKA